MRPHLIDPPSPGSAPEGTPVLADPAAHRNVGQPTIDRELAALPDDRLIATLTGLGCPRWFAEQIRTQPTIRFAAVATWCLVQDAAEGATVINARTGERTSARELVDGMREQYQAMRDIELISDRPDHTIGLWER